MVRKSQKEIVLNYLQKHSKGLTSMKAFWLWRITRLGARIFELRAKGHHIVTIMEYNVLVPGRHARYVLFKTNYDEPC